MPNRQVLKSSHDKNGLLLIFCENYRSLRLFITKLKQKTKTKNNEIVKIFPIIKKTIKLADLIYEWPKQQYLTDGPVKTARRPTIMNESQRPANKLHPNSMLY